MNEDTNFGNIPPSDHSFNDSTDYLKRATYAVESGDQVLGIHLYLAAFEQSKLENLMPSDETLAGMRAAWDLAVKGRQHSLAEYIFEKLKPYVGPDELSHKADELQDIALDRLEEFGFSREAIEDVAELINEDLMELGANLLCRFENEEIPSPFSMLDFGSSSSRPGFGPGEEDEAIDEITGEPYDPILGPAAEACKEDAPGSDPISQAIEAFESMKKALEEKAEDGEEPIELSAVPLPRIKGAKVAHINLPGRKKERKKKKAEPAFNYSTIKGFASVIEKMKHLGVGRMRDEQFKEFVKMLNTRHGVSRMPQLGTLVFTGQAREDSNYFMAATISELEIPAVRMRMETNMQGQTVLCVMASSEALISPGSSQRLGLDGPVVLMLEDFDLWDMSWMDMSSELPDFLQIQLSRGAREALSYIQAALENPEVTVFISSESVESLEANFGPMLGLYREVALEYPTDEERKEIWRAAQAEHPSMRGLDIQKLVPFSKGLSRYDIHTVISESIEEAYRRSVDKDCFCAVGSDDVYLRLSTFHELESKEYKDIEELVMSRFHLSIEHADDLLKED